MIHVGDMKVDRDVATDVKERLTLRKKCKVFYQLTELVSFP